MKHKWHKEIVAWSEGAEIEVRKYQRDKALDLYIWTNWKAESFPTWDIGNIEYRIKQQPKEPQYLYVYASNGEVNYIYDAPRGWAEDFVGKIKLEQDDE